MTLDEYERIQNGETVWIKNSPKHKISWKHSGEDNMVFRFEDDPGTEYYLYRDYGSLTKAQKAIFDRENPFWARFFAGR